MKILVAVRAGTWRLLLTFAVLVSIFGVSYRTVTPALPALALGNPAIQVTGGADVPVGSAANCALIAGSGSCPTLRDAIAAAQPNTDITFAPAVTTVNLSATVVLTQNVQIIGSSQVPSILGQNNDFSDFHVQGNVTAVISDVTIAGGGNATGGGIYNAGALTVTHVLLTDNAAIEGAALYNDSGTLVVTGTTVYSNVSDYSGGGITSYGGTLDVTGTTVISNSSGVLGGGIYSSDIQTQIDSSKLVSNTTGLLGGGIAVDSETAQINNTDVYSNVKYLVGLGNESIGPTVLTGGAGIANLSQLQVTGGTVYANVAGLYDGGAPLLAATVSHPLTSLLSGLVSGHQLSGWQPSHAHPSWSLTGAQSLHTSSLSCINSIHTQSLFHTSKCGKATGVGGGGIFNASSGTLDISGTTIYSNEAYLGGGVSNWGALTVTSAAVNANQAVFEGGGLLNSTGQAQITGTTVYSNNTILGSGGGIANDLYEPALFITCISAPSSSECNGTSGFTATNPLSNTALPSLQLTNSSVHDNSSVTCSQFTYNITECFDIALVFNALAGEFGAQEFAPASRGNGLGYVGGGGVVNTGNLNIGTTSLYNNQAFLFLFGAAAANKISAQTARASIQALAGVAKTAGPSSILGLNISNLLFGGGAVLNVGAATVSQSSLYNNLGLDGGAFENGGPLQIANTTVYSNGAITAGAIGAYTDTTTLSNTTIYSNIGEGAQVTLATAHSIVGEFDPQNPITGTIQAVNTLVTPGSGTVGPSCDLPLQDNGGNISNDATCGLTNPLSAQSVPTVQLPFGPLALNGGTTPNLALLPTSKALGFGTVAGCAQVGNVDQRGMPRPGANAPAGTTCDSGAFELQFTFGLGTGYLGNAIGLPPATLPGGILGISYVTTAISATGGVAPYTYGVQSGALPPGLTLDAHNAGISGTPTQLGLFSFTVYVVDSKGSGAYQNYSILVSKSCVVNGALQVPGGSLLLGHRSASFLQVGASPRTGSIAVYFNQLIGSLVRPIFLTVNTAQLRGCSATTAVVTGTASGLNLPAASAPTLPSDTFHMQDGLELLVSLGGTTPVSATVVVSDTTRAVPLLVITTAPPPGGLSNLKITAQ